MPRFSRIPPVDAPLRRGVGRELAGPGWADRRVHEFSLTREQLGQIALNGRRNAADNPIAVYRDPMDLADYLEARMISTPLCLFDCDAPSDGSTASSSPRDCSHPTAPRPACHVNAVGTALRGRASWDQFDDPDHHGQRDAAASMWERTDLGHRRGRGPALRRLLHPGHGVAGGPGLLRPGQERGLRRGGSAISRRRPASAQHRRRPAVGRPAPRVRPHPRGLRPAPGRGRGDHQVLRRGNALPEVAAVSNGGGPIAGTLLLTRGEG